MKRRHFLTIAGLAPALAPALALLPTPAHADDPPDSTVAIKARGKLLAGVKMDTPPFGFLNDKNEPAGFDLDILRAVAAMIGVPIEFVRVTSVTRVPLLLSGNVDVVAASMTHTHERERAIDFSEDYYIGGQTLLVPKTSSINGVGDLDGKRVAVQQGTTLAKNIVTLAPKASVTAYRDYDAAWLALAQSRADALTGSLSILEGFAKNNDGFKIVGGLLSKEPFGIGVRHGDWAMRNAVNATLQDLWTSGNYAKLYKTWFGGDPPEPIVVYQ